VPLLRLLTASGVAFATPDAPFGRDLALLLAVTLVVAALGYRYVERPALHLRRYFTRDGRFISTRHAPADRLFSSPKSG
jgi:peptidoglycan/LPS O-acetylase OafA/YrhL